MRASKPLTVTHAASHDQRWLDYLARSSPTLFQHPDWASLMEEVYGFPARVALVLRDGDVVGGLPYSEVEDFRGRRRVAGAFADVCEPLGQVWTEIEHALCQDGIPWNIRSRERPGPRAGTSRQIGLNLVADLPSDPDSAMSFCHRMQSKQARHAIREGLVARRILDSSALDVFYPLHARTRTAKYHLLPQPRPFFSALLRRYFPEHGMLVAAECAETVVAAAVMLFCGDTLYIKFSAADQSALTLRPMDFLFWNALLIAAEKKLRHVDLGISETESLVFFKRKYSTTEQPVFLGRYLPNPEPAHVAHLAAALSQLTAVLSANGVPLEAVEAASDSLYRYFV